MKSKPVVLNSPNIIVWLQMIYADRHLVRLQSYTIVRQDNQFGCWILPNIFFLLLILFVFSPFPPFPFPLLNLSPLFPFPPFLLSHRFPLLSPLFSLSFIHLFVHLFVGTPINFQDGHFIGKYQTWIIFAKKILKMMGLWNKSKLHCNTLNLYWINL